MKYEVAMVRYPVINQNYIGETTVAKYRAFYNVEACFLENTNTKTNFGGVYRQNSLYTIVIKDTSLSISTEDEIVRNPYNELLREEFFVRSVTYHNKRLVLTAERIQDKGMLRI